MNFNTPTMNARIIFSLWMIGLGLLLAFVPYKHNRPNQLTSNELLKTAIEKQFVLPVDKLARMLVDEDSTLQIIDLRSPDEYRQANLPGSVNIPYKSLLNKDFEPYLEQKDIKTVFYSNGDIVASQAWALCTGMGYQNLYIMQGGMNEWYKTVMHSSFSGERISAKENALFEVRYKARKLFTEMNSLPDSMKIKYLELKKKNTKKLDGGCG